MTHCGCVPCAIIAHQTKMVDKFWIWYLYVIYMIDYVCILYKMSKQEYVYASYAISIQY